VNSNVAIYVLSDSIGETAEKVIKAAISQFDFQNYEIHKFSSVTTMDILKESLNQTLDEKECIIFYTLVNKNMVEYLVEFTEEKAITAVDLIGPIINVIKDLTGLEPIREPGVIHKLDESYYKRIEAIEFAVTYDDGQEPKGLPDADLVIIGVSRTSKTPLSMYLANKNLKVANIPLVPETQVPKELFLIPSRKVIGLTNSPIKLNSIREERLKALGLPKGSDYASMERILQEIDYAEAIMKKIGCPIIDVSNKAIEETAEIILSILKKYTLKTSII